MTMDNGCVQEWHADQNMGMVAGVRRAFFWSHVTSGESPSCRDSSNWGVNIQMINGRQNMNDIDQQNYMATWTFSNREK
jgi:hypothetical protein